MSLDSRLNLLSQAWALLRSPHDLVEIQMFKLLRYFTLTSLFGIAVAAALTGLAYRELARRDMVEVTHAQHAELAAMLMSNTAFKGVVALANEGGQTHSSLNALIGADLPMSLVQVHVYDAAGRTIFSTDPNHSGPLGEQTALSVLLPDPRDAQGGMVASVIPFDPDHASVVLKLVSDVGLKLDKIAHTQVKLVASIAATLALLYGVLLVMVVRADRLIKQHDVERKTWESQQHGATYATPGLPNRALFQQRTREALSRAAKEKHFVALLAVQLDGGGDALSIAASRLTDVLRETDTLCRMDDGEFAIVLDEISGRAAVAEVTEKIVQALSPDPGKDTWKVRIGISLFPMDATHADMLLRGAELALKYARQSGKTVAYYQPRKMIAPVSLPDFPVVGEVLK